MECPQCGKDLSDQKKLKKFCSRKCTDEFKKAQPRQKFDETKQYRCKIDGKCFSLGCKKSGQLKKYSVSTLNKEFDITDWEIIDKEPINEERWNCPYCDWHGKTADGLDGGGWVGLHLLNVHGLTKDAHVEKFPHDHILWPHKLKQIQRGKDIMLHEDNRIQCLECGEWLKKVTETHLRMHGMNPAMYRQKYNISNLSSISTRQKLSKLYFENDKLLDNNYVSRGQNEIKEFIENELGFSTKIRRVAGVELDIFVPDKNIAIEYNGLYWHSELHGGKTKDYHLNKTEYCEQNDIHLIHVFEDEWLNSKDIIKSRLANLFGKSQTKIFAKQCVIKEIPSSVKNEFLDANHLQKSDASKYKIGLFYDDELVSVMTFRKPHVSMGYKSDTTLIELSRFANKLNYNVVGGASKLFKYALKTYEFNHIISFADRRWTSVNNQTLYDTLGFTRLGSTQPNYWYMERHVVRRPRYDFAKHVILQKFTGADPDKSEWENMKMFGWDRIWDCGSLKFEFILK